MQELSLNLIWYIFSFEPKIMFTYEAIKNKVKSLLWRDPGYIRCFISENFAYQDLS